MKYKHMITDVFVFTNGMVAVCDQNGELMPKFQGERTFNLMKKIKDRIQRQKIPVTWHGKFPEDH